MAAYVLIDYHVTDETVFAGFVEQAPAVVEAHGGKYLARNGATEVVQGSWTPRHIVVLEFDSVERARGWQNAPDYADLRKMLNRSANADVIIVEGV